MKMHVVRFVLRHGYKIAAVNTLIALFAAWESSPWWLLALLPVATLVALLKRIYEMDTPL